MDIYPMNKFDLEDIISRSVFYYENAFMYPETKKTQTRQSVIDYSGFFYAYAISILQSVERCSRKDAEIRINDLIGNVYNTLQISVRESILAEYTAVYLFCLQQFKDGTDRNEQIDFEGFMMVTDSNSIRCICLRE